MVTAANWSHETVFPAEPTSVGLARDFVCRHLATHNLLHLMEDVCLVASELATNAVTHARTPFSVSLSRANASVLLVVRDESRAAPVRTVPDVMDASGRGLVLVELLSQEWGTSTDRHGSKSVWASFPSRPR